MTEAEELELLELEAEAAQPARASDAEIEAARPKTVPEIAWKGTRNFAAGAAKGLSNLAAGLGGLVSKGMDKIGLTNGMADAARTGHERMNQRIDSALGTENPDSGYALAQSMGEVGLGLAVPVERAVPFVSKAIQSAAHLPPHLAALAARTGVNTGYGAAQGEAQGHPVAGAITGLAGSGAGELARGVGGQIIKSYIKGGHRGAAEGLDIPWFLSQEMGGTGPGMAQKVGARLGGLKDQQSQIIAQKGDLPSPILEAFQNVENKIAASPAMAKNLGSLPAARAQLKDYVDDLIPIVDQQTGNLPLNLVWEVKKKAGNDAAALYRSANAGGDVKGMTKQGVSAMVVQELNDLIEKQAPELIDLNPEFSKLIPVAKALERRNRIAGQNNPIGLDELAAVDAGVNFMVHGEPMGAVLPLIQKASKSPYFGQLMRDASKRAGRLTALAPAVRDVTDVMSGNRGQE
jgi:hypothetical protein